VGIPSWKHQVEEALKAIDRRGESKHVIKKVFRIKPGQPVPGLFSYGTYNTVFDKTMTFLRWLSEHHPVVKTLSELTIEMTQEYIDELFRRGKAASAQTVLAALRKTQEGARCKGWIRQDFVPVEWHARVEHIPRGGYPFTEADALIVWLNRRAREYARAACFIRSSGARIDEVFHLRSDLIDFERGRVSLKGKGGKIRSVEVLHPQQLEEMRILGRFVFMRPDNVLRWVDNFERVVREGCDALGIKRRGVHGLRATAAREFLQRQIRLGATEQEARRLLAVWLGHDEHRTEVTHKYVSKGNVW